MSDLSTLFGASPNTAGMMMGQNQYDDRQQKAALLQQMLLKNQQDAAMNPLEQQFAQGRVDQQQAQLPGIKAHSDVLGMQRDQEMQLAPMKIAEQLEAMKGQIGESGFKRMAQDGERAGSIAAMAAKYPVAAHREIVAQAMKQYGADPNSPITKALQDQKDEDILPTLKVMSEGIALASGKFHQARTMNQDKLDSAERVHKADRESREKIAKMGADSRVDVAELRTKAAIKDLTPDKAIAKLEMIPESERTEADNIALYKLTKYMLTKGAISANATTPTVLGQDTPIAAAGKAADSLQTPRTQASAKSDDIASAVSKAGWKYEPNKYHYRVVNGIAERAPK